MARRAAAALIAILAVIAACLTGMSCAQAEGRVALVIGNSGYDHLPRLNNPKNDAADVAQAFERLGFNVTTVQDASFEQFRLALLEFGRAASDADMAVLFYAGHGVEVTGENWLLPVDTDLKSDVDVSTEAITLRRAMLSVSNAKLLGLVILDACRNNAFANVRRTDATRAADRGLAPIDPAENVLVAYAARDGTTARDGAGRNSPFTAALLRHLETPGLELEFLFRNVRDDVWNATNGEQQPFLYGSLSRDEVYLNDVVTSTQTAEAKPAPTEDTVDPSDLTWSFVRTTFDVDTLRRFTEQFPTSARTADAKVRIAALESQQKSDAPAGGLYSVASTESVRLDDEDLKLARPFRRNSAATEAAWKVLKDSKDVTIVRRFVDHFPSGRRRVALENRPVLVGTRLASAAPIVGDARPVIITREVMLQAAEDEDVLKCFQLDDIAAAECRRALERYPLISQFSYDYRFRLTLCRALGDACGNRRDLLQNNFSLQGKALFNPANVNPAAAPAGVVIAPNYGPTGTPPGGPGRTPDARVVTDPGGTPPMPRILTSPGRPRAHLYNPHGKDRWGTLGSKNLGSKNFGVRTLDTKTLGTKTLGHKTFHFGAHNFKTVPKSFSVNTNIKTTNVTVKTFNAKTLGAVNVRVTGANIKVPTVKVPTVRVPTIRVPTVRIPH